MEEKFQGPDEASLARMTPATIEALLETLRDQRAEKVKQIDVEIRFYEEELIKRKGPQRAAPGS